MTPRTQPTQELCDLYDHYQNNYQTGTSRKEKFFIESKKAEEEPSAGYQNYNANELNINTTLTEQRTAYERYRLIPLRAIMPYQVSFLVGCGNKPLSDDGTMKIFPNSERGQKFQDEHNHDMTVTMDICMSRNSSIVGNWGTRPIMPFFGEHRFLKAGYEGIDLSTQPYNDSDLLGILHPAGVIVVDNRTPENLYTQEDYKKFSTEYKNIEDDNAASSNYKKWNCSHYFLSSGFYTDRDDFNVNMENIFCIDFLNDIRNLKDQRERMLRGLQQFSSGMQETLSNVSMKTKLAQESKDISAEIILKITELDSILKEVDRIAESSFFSGISNCSVLLDEKLQECRRVDTDITNSMRKMNISIESYAHILQHEYEERQIVKAKAQSTPLTPMLTKGLDLLFSSQPREELKAEGSKAQPNPDYTQGPRS